MANVSKKSLADLAKALNVIADSSTKTAAVMEKQTKTLDEMTKATNESTKATKDADSQLKKHKDNLEDIGDDLDDVHKKMEAYRKEAAKIGKMAGFKTTLEVAGFDKIKTNLTNYRDELKQAQEQLQNFQKGKVNEGDLDKAQKNVREIRQRIRGVEKELDIANQDFKEAFKDPTPARAIGNIDEGVTGIGSAFGALSKSPLEFADHMKNASDQAERLKNGSAILGRMPGLLGMAGKAAGGLAGAFGGITKMLAGWPGMIAMAVVGLAKAATNIDSYIKNTNKRFAEIRGPEIMTGDLKKQFNDFNKAVFNVAANIRDGLVPEQVYEFMFAIGTAGKRLSTLNEGFYSYRDAVNVAAKASKVFGLDMATVGSLMGKMATDFKMNLGDMDDAFVQMSFDAQKSGLSTDRFMTAVQNASVGLSFFGTFLKTASKVMSDFGKTQVIGADEAASATQEIVQAFAKMDTKKAMGFLALLPKQAYDSMVKTFKDLRKESAEKAKALGEQAIDVEAELKVVPPDKKDELMKKLDQLRTDQKKNMEISDRLQGAANGNIMSMAQNIGNLSDKSPQASLDIISAIGGMGDITKLDDNKLEVALQGVEKIAGLSQKTIKILIAETRANGKSMDIGLGIDQANVEAVLDQTVGAKKEGKGLLGYLKKIHLLTKKGVKEEAQNLVEAKSMTKNLMDPLKSLDQNSTDEMKNDVAGKLAELLGMTKEETGALVVGASYNKKFKAGLTELIQEVSTGKITPEKMLERLTKLQTTTGVSATLQKNAFKADSVASEEVQSAYDKTFKGIVDQTLSIDDMKDIAKKQLEYAVKSFSVLQNMSYGISKMAREKVGELETKKMADATEKLQKDLAVTFKGKGKEKVSVKGGEAVWTTTYVKDLMKSNYDTAKNMDMANGNLTTLNKLQHKNNPTAADLKQLETLKKGKTVWENIVTNGDKTIKENNEILGQLQESGAADQDMIDLLRIQTAGGKDSEKVLLDIARKRFPGMTKVSLDQMKELKNIGPGLVEGLDKIGRIDRKDVMMSQGSAVGGVPVMKKETQETVNLGDIPVIPKKQGLMKPEQVTQAGAVILHPGESILPKSDTGFKTAPIMEPDKVPTAVPTEKNITINVNATERDLAQRIANEIRGFFYKEHVNNQG